MPSGNQTWQTEKSHEFPAANGYFNFNGKIIYSITSGGLSIATIIVLHEARPVGQLDAGINDGKTFHGASGIFPDRPASPDVVQKNARAFIDTGTHITGINTHMYVYVYIIIINYIIIHILYLSIYLLVQYIYIYALRILSRRMEWRG